MARGPRGMPPGAPQPTFGFGPGFAPQRLSGRSRPAPGDDHVVYFHINPGVSVSFQGGDTTHLIQGPVTVPMVPTSASPSMGVPVQVPPGHVLQQIVDEHGALRHVILSPQPPPPHLPPHLHAPPPPPQHYGPANGGNGPQQYYGPPGYPPPHFHPHGPPMPPPPHHPHSPPHSYHKDERAQRQFIKLRRKLEQKQIRNDSLGFNSGHSTPALSPRKEFSNGTRRGGPGLGGTSSEGEGSSSAATSVQGDEDDSQPLLDYLSLLQTPIVSDVTARSALVQWSAPSSDGGTPPPPYTGELRYDLLLGDKGRYKAIYSGPSLSCRVQDLRPGTEYSVCLQAHVEGHTGSASGAALVRTPACEPAAPTSLRTVSRARNALQLRWSAPADHGSPIRSYVLQYDKGTGGDFVDLCRPQTKQHHVQRLEGSTRYRFRLAAVNEAGQGPWCDEVAFRTCGAPPPPPAPPSLVRSTARSLLLEWERRPGDEEFALQFEDERTHHGFLSAYSGRYTEYLCENLVRYSDYKFRLRALNEEGGSRWSEEVVYRTLSEAPAPPPKPHVKGKIHSDSFRVRWDPPADRGGADIQSYTLEIQSGREFELIYRGSEREATCDRLQPGHAYNLRVSCTAAGGTSGWSDITTVTTEAVVPGPCPPLAPQGEPRPRSLTVQWREPDRDGGSPVLQYNVEISDEESSRIIYEGKETECTVRDLLPGRRYSFQVKAFNRVGGGPWSESLELTTGPAPPEIPDAPRAVAKTPFSVIVDWEEPPCNGAPVLDYRLEMTGPGEESEDFFTVFRGPQTSFEVKNLIPFAAYVFRVCASNRAGVSEWSGEGKTVTPCAAPGAPPAINAEVTATGAFLAWQEPISNGAPITHYRVDTGERVIVTDGPVPECTLDNLVPETVYRVRIQAVNEIGIGNFSPTLKVSTLPSPPSPPSLSCAQQGHNFLKLKWGDGKNADFTQYIVEMQNPRRKEYQVVYQGTSLTFRVKKLQESTKYNFRICASNDAGGQGDFSDDFEFETTPAPPSSMKVPRLTDITTRSATVELSFPKPLGDDPLVYIVQCCRAKDQDYKQVYKGSEVIVTIEELEGGCEYLVRACAVGAGLQGPWSPALTVQPPAPASAPTAPPAVPKRAPRRATQPASVSDRHCVLLILATFVFIAVVAAIAVERFIDWRKAV